VKIGFKFQSLGKISNISAADPPVLLGQFQHWLLIDDGRQTSLLRQRRPLYFHVSQMFLFLLFIFCLVFSISSNKGHYRNLSTWWTSH